MEFIPVDLDTWARKEHFEHYFHQVPCTYSMTTKLDITPLIEAKERLYPAMLYRIAKAVNQYQEFRMDLGPDGTLGFYTEMHPCYTIFHRDSETFSNLWTEYTDDYEAFCRAYQQDLEQFGSCKDMMAKPDVPVNTFPVSMVPWESFEGFNLNLQNGYRYLPPIFTMGKYQRDERGVWLPLSIQVNHAVCDGFHVCRFIAALREML
ncbi:type A chloramphenicol O-acetyltransferase [Pseudoflavonifractor sp. DSM 107456]|uniref:Type A chloramphenicol O-acetyltransferase n=1 Tax=Pseudoflavonifractor gallinarum TaxID=2779352 RepID=A0ABR9RAK5_9FIRM|nr:type A chloramphenicol O-acetyltransferase [Pseudoflavonifractor gallinarum]MBE5055734.1 type A chloramphenicol O-acetyltransferase [Pseudoflavonifractor gallinarum]